MAIPIHVLIVERQRLVAESIQRALESAGPDLRIVGVATTRDEASVLAEIQRPDVVIVDSQLADEVHAGFARSVGGDTAMVMLGNDDGEEVLLTAVQGEWRGYVDKDLPLQELVGVIRRVANGEVVMPADLLYRAILAQSRKKRNGNGADVSKLTIREREVLDLIGHGLDNKTIAVTLGIRLTTARSHVQRVLEKLGVHSKLQAAKYADGSFRRAGVRRQVAPKP